MLLELPAGRTDRIAVRVHMRFERGSPALAQVARRASHCDVLPCSTAAMCARNNVVEGQFAGGSAINATETVAQEQVEPGERRIFVGPNELPQGNDGRKLERAAWAVDLSLIMRDDVDPLEKHRLDRRLPGP